MNDLIEVIRNIIKKRKEEGSFSILDLDESAQLIKQILGNYEEMGQISRKDESLPKGEKKKAELVFVAAPTGAGKDCLVTKLNYQNPDKKYVELNMDIFRHYFPLFVGDISNITDKNFATKTNEFAYEIYSTIQDVILQEFPGTNVIITGTLRETDWVEEVFKKFKSAENTDYTVRLACLAVPKKESAISVVYRYLAIINTQRARLNIYPGTARYTAMEYHDETFEKFPKNFGYFQKSFLENPGKMIDAIEVYKRSRDFSDLSEDTKVYSSEKPENGQTALDAIMKLRDKKYEITYDDFALISKRILKNKDYLKSQGTLGEIIRDLAVLLNYPKVVGRLDELKDLESETNLR